MRHSAWSMCLCALAATTAASASCLPGIIGAFQASTEFIAVASSSLAYTASNPTLNPSAATTTFTMPPPPLGTDESSSPAIIPVVTVSPVPVSAPLATPELVPATVGLSAGSAPVVVPVEAPVETSPAAPLETSPVTPLEASPAPLADPVAPTVDVISTDTATTGLPAGWRVDAGPQLITASAGTVTFQMTLNSSLLEDEYLEGGRIRSTWSATSAISCASIKPPAATPGVITSLYATSGEPVDRINDKWDEIDVELMGIQPEQMWVNQFHDGQIPGQNGGYKPLGFDSSDGFHEYCLDWDLAKELAVWYVDGKQFTTYPLTGWVKPMHMAISLWGVNVPTWSGTPNSNDIIYAEVKDIKSTIRTAA